MTARFEQLCKNLQIDSLCPTDADLSKLVGWFESTVSTDFTFEGEVKKRFNSYQSIAEDFLENVLPYVTKDKITTPVAVFNDRTPLQVATELGFNVYLRELEPTSAQINTPINGVTLLALAASRGNLHTVETLLSLGADPLVKNITGTPLLATVLMLPIVYDEKMMLHKEAIFSLLSGVANSLLQERSDSGDTVLHTMSVYGYKNLMVDLLAHSPELASIPNKAMKYPIHSAILNDQPACVEVLLAFPGVEQLRDSKGRNALHYAAKYSDDSMISICLRSSISKDSIDKRGQTPLILAAIAQNSNAVKVLIDSGVQVDLTDDVDRSALHYAVEANDLISVTSLLASPHIDVNIKDSTGHTPFDLIHDHTLVGDKITTLLLQKGATPGKSLTSRL